MPSRDSKKLAIDNGTRDPRRHAADGEVAFAFHAGYR